MTATPGDGRGGNGACISRGEPPHDAPTPPAVVIEAHDSDTGNGVLCGVSVPGQGTCRNIVPVHQVPMVCPRCKRWT